MSLKQRLGAVVVALFAVVFTRTPWLIRLMNPVMRRYLDAGLPAGPNALLTVRGRKSGRARSQPVSVLAIGELRYVQAATTSDAWVLNARANPQALLKEGRRGHTYDAAELEAERAGRLVMQLLSNLPKSRLVRRVVGPHDRPPVGVLHYFGLRVDDSLDQYVASARRQPIFELRPAPDDQPASSSSR